MGTNYYLYRPDTRTAYDLGKVYEWRALFGHEEMALTPADAQTFAQLLRLHSPPPAWDPEEPAEVTNGAHTTLSEYLNFVARDIIRWADGKLFRFASLDDGELERASMDAHDAGTEWITGTRFRTRWDGTRQWRKFYHDHVGSDGGSVLGDLRFDGLASHVGKTIESVWLRNDRARIAFVFADGTRCAFRAEADGGGLAWIEDVTDLGFKGTFLGVGGATDHDDQLNKAGEAENFVINTNFYDFRTEHGRLLVELRTAHNGYYNGLLVEEIHPSEITNEWRQIE